MQINFRKPSVAADSELTDDDIVIRYGEGDDNAWFTVLPIGGKEDPVRLVFDAHPGPAVAACVTDMGDRFRMVASVVDVVPPEQPLPKLPVARAMWHPRPDLKTNAAAWIHSGGSHHTSLGFAVTAEHLSDFAAMCSTELLVIDEETRLDTFRDRLRWNDLYHHLARGL